MQIHKGRTHESTHITDLADNTDDNTKTALRFLKRTKTFGTLIQVGKLHFPRSNLGFMKFSCMKEHIVKMKNGLEPSDFYYLALYLNQDNINTVRVLKLNKTTCLQKQFETLRLEKDDSKKYHAIW